MDGENFRHSISGIFSEFTNSEYLPKQADWTGFFDMLVKKVCNESDVERIRTYWYVIQSLDFSPYKFPSAEHKPNELNELLCRDDVHKNKLAGLSGEELVNALKKCMEALFEAKKTMQNRFNGWQTMQNAISTRHRAIEFRRAGAIRCNLFDKKLGAEKAVDVKLATDLIMLRDIYDIAIIVSGDQDYVPSVQVLKDSGKEVVNVAFKTRSGKLFPGGARRLNQETDWSFDVLYEEFKQYLKIG